MTESLREQLQLILTSGLSKDALAHADQVARVAWVLHEAFGKGGLRSTVVGGSAIELHAPSAVFEIVKKEVVLADRIVGFRQWQVLAWGQQAIDLVAAFGEGIDEPWLRDRLAREGSLDALDPLRVLAVSDDLVTEATLARLLTRLRTRPGQ